MELIAEVGCNWTSMGNAKDYIHKCKELGIKFVKFQMFKPEQVPASVKHLIIGKKEAAELFAFGQLEDVNVFFTPFYVEAVDILEELGVRYYKIRFKDRNNTKLLKRVYKAKMNVFISVDKDLHYKPPWIQFLCIPKYPADMMDYLQINLDLFSGISDHTDNLLLYELALKRNLEYFEMHVCFSHDDIEGKWSKTFDELAEVLK